jgi:hypothetical protein
VLELEFCDHVLFVINHHVSHVSHVCCALLICLVSAYSVGPPWTADTMVSEMDWLAVQQVFAGT